ncbi:PAS domain-containing protein [Flavobacterium sp. N1994]|uniref:PAS domain-containing protein n=1 Tax=Flavobacterium sp. N1994 TaxID=2986827 RepID=UPI002221318A|nr:PAS domain-containing protein [Flavobacterium sp. N1994]
MSESPIVINKTSFNNIFPFHIIIDEDLKLKSFGTSLSKIYPKLAIGEVFSTYFNIKRPLITTPTPQNIKSIFNQLVVITDKKSNELSLRGQFEPHENGVLFVGSPWLVSMDEMVDNKLTISDFAKHDPLLDILHVLKNQEIKNQELEELLETINNQKKELKQDKENLNIQSLVASANKNGVVLTNAIGDIIWCNKAYESIVNMTSSKIIGKNILSFGPCKITGTNKKKKILEDFRKGIIFEGEKNIVTKNNKKYYYKTTKQPIKNEQGEVINYFAVIEDISVEKEREEQLLLLSSIAEKSFSAVIITDEKGNTEWVNQSLLNMTGYTFDEFIEKKPGELLHGPESCPNTISYLKEQIKNGEAFYCEMLHYTKSKEKYWVRLNGQSIHDKNGKVFKFFATMDDITIEKEHTEQILTSEERLNSLIANLQSGILLEDENRKIILVNKKFCDLFGIPLEPHMLKDFDCEVMAEQSKDFFKNPDAFLNRIKDILQKKEIVITEEIELTDGRSLERSFIPMHKGEKLVGYIWCYEDVTLKKRYYENIAKEREKYSNIIANMNMGLLEVDKHDIIKLANQSFSNMSGYSIEELLEKKATDLFVKDTNKSIIENKTKERNIGQSNSYEVPIVNKYGEEKYWMISGAPNYNLNGEIIGSIGIHLDITEQKKLELQKEQLLKRLETQNERLNEYAHMVSHDLKSPLRSIHSLISWVKEDNMNLFNETTMNYFELIEDKVEKMDNLIQGILTYSKVDSNKEIKEKIDLNEIVQNCIKIIHIPENINVNIKKELPIIETDLFRMQQLFQNLISNAVNYIDKKEGIVEIDYQEHNKEYLFSIKDNGQGIDHKYQRKIFDLFQTISEEEQSTGIGLSIVKRIVDYYHGTIWLESSLGIGTTFFIKLPKNHGKT